MKIIGLIQKQPAVFSMAGANKLKFIKANEDSQARFTLITNILNDLNGSK